MGRALPTISLLLAALAGFALVRGCRDDIAVPVEGPPPIALEPAVPPPAAAPSTTASGAGDAPAAGAPQVWVELHALARFHLPRAPAVEVTRLGQSVDAQVEIVAGDPDADPPAVARPAPRLLRVRLGGDVWHRQ